MANGGKIEDYFHPTGDARKKPKRQHATANRSEEANESRQPLRTSDELLHAYKFVYLGELSPGPQRVIFQARIVNIYDMKNTYYTDNAGGGKDDRKGGRSTTKKGSRAAPATSTARGCLKIVAKDDTGYILISLWYADSEYEDVHLGALVSAWTTHVSAPKAGLKTKSAASGGSAGAGAGESEISAQPASLTTSIFPERDRTCRLIVHVGADDTSTKCRLPLGYSPSGLRFWGVEPLADVLAKKGTKGNDATRQVDEGGKVLVYVKALAGVETYVNAQGISTAKLDVGLADYSGEEVILTLFGRMLSSAVRSWVAAPHPNATLLLVSNASWKTGPAAGRRVVMSSRTTVEVDPDIMEAGWLRTFAEGAEGWVNPEWKEGVFDVEAFESSPRRIKFTLKDIDEFARSAPTETVMGYASVMITEVNLAYLYKERRLFCAECCNMPIFANALNEACGQCGKDNQLRLNAQIIGSLTDETGSISISSRPHSYTTSNMSPTKFGVSRQYENNSPTKRRRGGSSPLLWSPAAWRDILGREPAKLLTCCGLTNTSTAGLHAPTLEEESGSAVLAELEALGARISFLRITICFGWSPELGGGRLAICRVLE